MSDPAVLRSQLMDAVWAYGVAHWRLGVAGEHPGPSARPYDAEGMDAWRRVGETLINWRGRFFVHRSSSTGCD